MQTFTRSVNVTIGTSSTEIAPEVQRPSLRKLIVMTNISTGGQVISVSDITDAIANTGIVLAVGGSYSEFVDPAFLPSQKPFNAISSGAGGILAVREVIIS